MNSSTPDFPVLCHLQELTQTHVHWVGDAIQPSHSQSSPSLSAFFLSIRIFSNESVICMRWPQYWSFSFSISPSNEYPGLISFRIDWFFSPCSPRDSQESSPKKQFKSINSLALSFLHSPTLKSIHVNWKNHSFDYMDLCWQSYFSAFYYAFRLVIIFLSRNKCPLISCLQSPSQWFWSPRK